MRGADGENKIKKRRKRAARCGEKKKKGEMEMTNRLGEEERERERKKLNWGVGKLVDRVNRSGF